MLNTPIQRNKITHGLFSVFISVSMVFSVPLDAQEESEEAMLELQQTSPIQFPKITINEASRLGSLCVANDSVNPANALCPNGQGQAAKFRITGSSHKLVSIFQNSGSVNSQGFRFSIMSAPVMATLNAQGSQTFSLGGALKLLDKNAVTDGQLQFPFDISVAYQ